MVTSKGEHCKSGNMLCPACALFGCLGRGGRLGFSSFPAEDTEGKKAVFCLPQLYSHPQDFAGRRFYKHSDAYGEIARRAEGRKGSEYYECLLSKAVLRGYITYQSLTEDQLGGLLFALGLSWGMPVFHKLGYAKPAYFGSVQLAVEQVKLGATLISRPQTHDLEALAEAYYNKHKSAIKDVVDQFKTEWGHIGSDNAWDMQNLTY